MMKKLLALIAIISTLSMVSTMVIQEASAAPKDNKQTAHMKTTDDPDTGDSEGKFSSNYHGPNGHEKCTLTWNYDGDTGEYEEVWECK